MDDLDLMNNDSLRTALEEYLNQIQRLEESQFELAKALESEPNDSDYIEAIEDNNVTLMTKRKKALEYHETLLRRDPVYRTEPYLENAALASILGSQLPVGVISDTAAVAVENEEQQEGETLVQATIVSSHQMGEGLFL